MKLQEFKKHLDGCGYKYASTDHGLVVTHQGWVELRSLTTLPEGVKFENQGWVYLNSLTTLPEGMRFENQGSVELNSLTTLPEGVKFENQGGVYLNSLTTLPEGMRFENQGSVELNSLTTLPEGMRFENQGWVELNSLTTLPEGMRFENQGWVELNSLTTLPEGMKFENEGAVYLNSLTTLPEGVKFENQGGVYLNSLNGQHNYLGKNYIFKCVDGYTMIITSTKEKGDFKIYRAKYFKGGAIKDMKICYIAEKGDFTAHGETAKQAVEDVNFKHMQANLDISELVESIKKSKTVTKNDYRLLTGACSSGCDYFMSEHGIKGQSVSLAKCKELVKDAFGGDKFNQLFS